MFEQIFNIDIYSYNPYAIPTMLSGIFLFCIGAFILMQPVKTVKNVSFFLFCSGSSLWLFTIGFVYMCKDPDTALMLYKTFTFFGVVNMMPNLYLFSADASGLLNKRRPMVIGMYVLSYGIYLLALLTDKFITTPTEYFWGLYPHYESTTYPFLVFFLIVFFMCQANLKIAYDREEVPVKKAQIRLIMVGLLFALPGFLDFTAKVFNFPFYPFGYLPMTILTCMLAYSIIKYKAFDIETVIHKTFLWVLSFAIITIPLAAIYMWIYPVVGDSLKLQIAYGVVCFIAVTVYMRVIQPKIDHFFQRGKAGMEAINARFAEQLVHLQGFHNLIQLIEETVTNALYPQWIDVFIFNDEKRKYVLANRGGDDALALDVGERNEFLLWLKENNRIVYNEFVDIDPVFMGIREKANDYFHTTKAVLAIPLIVNERLLGVINLGKKANLSRYRALDLHFLTTLKNQAAIAISNSLIYQNIEEQVKKRTAELMDVQKQLVQAEKLATVGTLSGGVAHEINNPLTAILTNVQMLLAMCDDKGTEVDRESLELMEEATQRCRTIVQKLMAYAKKPMESGELSKIDLKDVLEKAAAFLRYQLEQDNVKIKVNAPEGKYPIMGNHNELEQVLTNIILNARDAIVRDKKKGDITVTLSKDHDQIKLEVKDEGGGIPKDVLPKIFDPFFTTKDVGKGLGLGLSICQSIIEKHKGRINVRSEKGAGAVFTVELPQAAKAAEAEKPAARL